jgi:hypothetical protein
VPDDGRRTLFERFLPNLLLLAFGVGTLLFLVAVEHQDWFELRPVSGTAAAMSQAADRPVQG